MSAILKQEFKLLKIVGIKPMELEDRLNRLGAQGWNLVPLPMGSFVSEHIMLTRTDYVNTITEPVAHRTSVPGGFVAESGLFPTLAGSAKPETDIGRDFVGAKPADADLTKTDESA